MTDSTTSSMQIRVYRRGDALPMREAVGLFGDEVERAWIAARDLQPAQLPSAEPVCLIAFDEHEVIMGGVYLLLEHVSGGRNESTPDAEPAMHAVASLRQLVVNPQFRGRGLAGKLLRQATAVAKDYGCDRIRSTAGWGCHDHLAMYERLGYQRARGETPYLVTRGLREA